MKSIVKLSLAGDAASFASDPDWLRRATGSILCPHCHNVYGGIGAVDAVVRSDLRDTDLDLIAVNCHGVNVLSDRLIAMVDVSLIEHTACLGDLFEADNRRVGGYRTAVAKEDRVIIRGLKSSNAGLCRQCSRLLYWPIGGSYILESELPDRPFFFSDGSVFCTPSFFEERLKGAGLNRVEIITLPILEEPRDELPTSFAGLLESLRLAKRFK